MPFVSKLTGILHSYPILSQMSKCTGNGLAIGFCVATACLAIIARVYLMGKSRNSHSGSVADLVRRGQLRSDRRGMYDFNRWQLYPCYMLICLLGPVSIIFL